jgi:hypothetical protein
VYSRNIIEPDYDEAMRQPRKRAIVMAIAEEGGTSRFSTIARITGVRDNVLVHHLNGLRELGIIESALRAESGGGGGGPYSLTYKTPLCFIFSHKQRDLDQPLVYMGLLGKRNGRKESETTVALHLLKKNNGMEFTSTCIITSVESAQQWSNTEESRDEWILLSEKHVSDIDSVKKKVESILTRLIKQNMVIMDCTSLTKPATIAMYELAQKYLVPLVYVYEPQRKLKWLISRETLLRRFRV